MGVMPCNRNDCTRIMCDTYIEGAGYICDECKEEFKEYLKQNNIHPRNEWEMIESIKQFMKTSKGQFDESGDISVDSFFKERTR